MYCSQYHRIPFRVRPYPSEKNEYDGVERVVRHRIEEQLQRERHRVMARARGDHGGEVPAGAVAGNPDPVGIEVQVGSVVRDPLRRRPRVRQPRRERMLGREAVVDRDDDHARPLGERTCDPVV
jgi:hypothetical protein